MGFMKRDNHLDPELLDLFVRSGIYRTYAQSYLPPELIDDVDEAAILAIEPAPFERRPEVPAPEVADFLPMYQPLVGNVLGTLGDN